MDVLGVVPIFMSAGAAVLPTILAAVASVAAVVLKPREVLRMIRQNPKAVAISAGVFLLCFVASLWWFLAPAVASAAQQREASHYDWSAVAQEILNQEQQGKKPTKVVSAAASAAPYVLGRDFTRCAYGGGPSPLELVPGWSYQFTKPDKPPASFFSAPAVAGKRVYAAGALPTARGYRGILVCIDGDTGKPIWEVRRIDEVELRPFYSSPAITADGNNLIIGEGLHTDSDCQLRCFDANTGQMRWAVGTTLHIESSPAIFGDMAVVGCGAIEGSDGKATGDPGHVLAVRISDGKELWRVPVIDPESSPAIDEAGTVYIGSGFNGSAIVAIRSASDAELKAKNLDRFAWRTPVAQPATSAITLAGDLVIAGAGNSDFAYQNPNPDGCVVALERATGKVRWQTKFPDAVLGAVAAAEGKLICPVRTGEIVALDQTDGHVLWRTPVSGSTPILAACAFTGKIVYAVSADGRLAVMDAADGKILQKININDEKNAGEGRCLSGPQIRNGRLIVGTETGGLRSFVGTRSAE